MVSRIKADQRIRQNALQEKRATPNHALEMRKMDHETRLKKMDWMRPTRANTLADPASAAGGHNGTRGVRPPGPPHERAHGLYCGGTST
jgi:hypothetical protein